MDINTYKAQKAKYYKVLVGLLLLTTLTFVQPHLFLENATFAIQLMIGAVKAWLIVMYYMHLKGETLIGWTVAFAIALVVIFFATVITDVNHFQFKDSSYITEQHASAGEHVQHHEE